METQRGSIPPQWRHPPATRRNCFCACWESNPGHKHGRLVCCHYTTCAHATRKTGKGARFLPRLRPRKKCNSYTPQGKPTHPDDTLAEWLRRRPAKPMGSPCVGSNPTGVVFASARRPRLEQAKRPIVCDAWQRDAALMKKADSTLRTSQAVPHPSTIRALSCLTSEVRRDPVHSTRYGRQRKA